jgi:Kef-type K+ transport system membrane component KefB
MLQDLSAGGGFMGLAHRTFLITLLLLAALAPAGNTARADEAAAALEQSAQNYHCAMCRSAFSEVDASGGHHGNQTGHNDRFAGILLPLALILLATMVGHGLATWLRQPPVLGELLIGIVVGNVLYQMDVPSAILAMHIDVLGDIFGSIWESGLSVAELTTQLAAGSSGAESLAYQRVLAVLTGPDGGLYVAEGFALWLFSNLGIILLLFLVGLQSRVEELLDVGPRAAGVAALGVVAPLTLGYAGSYLLLPEQSAAGHLFIATTLTATSVGITARVFQDLGNLHSPEARLILGAAIVDDIVGLMLLAVVVGMVSSGVFQIGALLKILLMSAAFLAFLVLVRRSLLTRLVLLAGVVERRHITLYVPLIIAFSLAWAADMIGLAAIVGAFAAGLIINREHFARYEDREGAPERLVEPLEALFTPVFFVLMGMQVNLEAFTNPQTLWLSLMLILVALAGKLACGLAAARGMDRLLIGIGMAPRGEVGLVCASIGRGLGVISTEAFSAMVLVVAVTTVITPIGLKWRMERVQTAR